MVSAVILTFNRCSVLDETLARVTQAGGCIGEVIVVDNASTDGTVELLGAKWPAVKLITLNSNIGVGGWNAGVRAASGACVLLLDDDCYPLPKSVEAAVSMMETDAGVGLVALHVLEGHALESATDIYLDWPQSFYGCACLADRSLFLELGGFCERLFVYPHEVEFSIRLKAAGRKIGYCSDAIAHHRVGDMSNQDSRKIARMIEFHIGNYPMILLLRFDLRKVIMRSVRIIAGRMAYGLYNGYHREVIRGLVRLFTLLPWICFNRAPVTQGVQDEYSNGSCFGGFFFDAGSYALRRPQWLHMTHD